MCIRKFIVIAWLATIALPSYAALEYIRIAGFAEENCIVVFNDCEFTLAQFGLIDGQSMYFDILFDTDADDPLNPDSSFQDNFAAVVLAGTAVLGTDYPALPLAQTSTFPEGSQTQFRAFAAGLALGTRLFDFDSTYTNLNIDTWKVGTEIDLYALNTFLYSEFINTTMAELTVVYRGNTPPPAIVPLPAAAWLFMSALCGMQLLVRRRRLSTK